MSSSSAAGPGPRKENFADGGFTRFSQLNQGPGGLQSGGFGSFVMTAETGGEGGRPGGTIIDPATGQQARVGSGSFRLPGSFVDPAGPPPPTPGSISPGTAGGDRVISTTGGGDGGQVARSASRRRAAGGEKERESLLAGFRGARRQLLG